MKKMMNILQLRGEFTDNGPGSQTLTIAEELRRRGHKVSLCSSGGKLTEKIKSKKFNYFIVPELAYEKRNILNVLKGIIALSRILKSQNIEIVHCHNAATSVMSWIASKVSGIKIKIFQSVRGVEIRSNFFWRNWVYKLKNFNALFAVCEKAKEILIGFGVESEKIIVTYNGTDLNRFDIRKKEAYRKEIRRELDIPLSATVIGIIGKQDGFKGHRDLVKVFSNLFNKYPELYIILVGEGKELEENKKLAESLRINSRAIFTGLRLDSEKLHASFDIFTLLSIKGYEMFPNVIIEAMTYGNSFVATDTQGVPETAKNSEGIICNYGELKEYESAFINLLDNSRKREEMGKRGIESVRSNFNIGEVVNKIENAYGEL